MEKIINTLINSSVQGADTYTHNDSTWLIFTESKQWVIELTKEKTLWYNYTFFKSLFAYASLDAVQNQHLITKWVEDNIIKTLYSKPIGYSDYQKINDVIENGVRHTDWGPEMNDLFVDDALENGVKETNRVDVAKKFFDNKMDVTIENGVKETHDDIYHHKGRIDGVIKSGIKSVGAMSIRDSRRIDETIENGIKKTKPMDNWVNTERIVSNVVDNGVKETKTPGNGDLISYIDWLKENKISGCGGYRKMIEDVINNGVIEIKPLPSQTGNKDWSEYSHGREDRTKPFNDYLSDTLEMGVKIN